MKHNFKLKDILFDIRYGWMNVVSLKDEIEENLILRTEKQNGKYHPLTYDYYDDDIKFLSFEEYTLEGIIQERPKEKFEIGSMGFFYDNNDKDFCMYAKLNDIIESKYPYRNGNTGYKNFSLTPPDLNY